MKRNVDLTEDMMFSRELNDYHHTFPWSTSSNYTIGKFLGKMSNEQISQKDNIIGLGSASDRERFHEIQKAVSDLFCDRCGKEIRILPWRPVTGLCFKCQSQLHQQFVDRCPWRENT